MRGIRIGELARRTGLSVDVLRAWERRFGLFQPQRTSSGYRLYSERDERIAHDVIALKAQGVPLAKAVALARDAPIHTPTAQVLIARVDDAVRSLDPETARRAVAAATQTLGVEAAMVAVYLPYLRLLGQQWQDGTVTVAHEHFISHIIRKHIGSLAQDLHPGGRRTAVMACPPGERHDIALLMISTLLTRRGWTVRYLGGDTPLDAVASAAVRARADLVVLGATRPEALAAAADTAARLVEVTQVAIGGPGASQAIADEIGATLLVANPVHSALRLDELIPKSADRFKARRQPHDRSLISTRT
ncbi:MULTISPECIES: MerR family transcriptional regulator [Janibacter]|uniref:MerR family transcriptional regulator n=1 Tax=Janibacter TaxID=53457 RepID=UPI00255A0435|nr:MerR family transcriptional regulator [Janibacter melonis]MCM3556680.1 MerR family transcriptional regulator [Janibacter melonis]